MSEGRLLPGVARNFAYLFGGPALAQVVGFVAAVIVARWLGADSLGQIRTALAVLAPWILAIDFGLDRMVIRDSARDPGRLASNVYRLLPIRIGLGVLAIGIAVVTLPVLPYEEPVRRLAALAAPFLLLNALTATALIPFLTQQEGRVVAETHLIRQGTYLVALVALLGRSPTAVAVIASLLCAHGVATAYALARMRRRLGPAGPFPPDPGYSRRMVPPALWFAAGSLLAMAVMQLDILMLSALRGTKETGVFAVAWSLLNALLMAMGALYSALLPVSASRREPAYFRALGRRLAQATVGALVMAAALAFGARPIIVTVFGEPFADAAGVLAILAWVFPLQVAGHWYVQLFDATGNQKIVTCVTAVMLAAGAALYATLIPRHGMMGAAWATLAVHTVPLVVCLPFALRVYGRLTTETRSAP